QYGNVQHESPDIFRTMRSNQYRYIRCHDQNTSVPCWQVFQAVSTGVAVVPWIAAWYAQLRGSLAGSACIALIAFRYDTRIRSSAVRPPMSRRTNGVGGTIGQWRRWWQ